MTLSKDPAQQVERLAEWVWEAQRGRDEGRLATVSLYCGYIHGMALMAGPTVWALAIEVGTALMAWQTEAVVRHTYGFAAACAEADAAGETGQ